MKYAIITDPDKCLQHSGTTVEGIPANREEWEKHDFYPTYDVVGEVFIVNGITVLKVDDGIFVPMDGGIEEITEQYYLEHKANWKELRESTIHSIDNYDRYVKDRYETRRPESGIILSKANYYLTTFKRLRMIHADHYVDAYMEYSAGLDRTRLRGLDFLPEDVRTIADYVKKVITSEQEDPKDDTIVSWVVGVCTDAYLSKVDSLSPDNQDKVFREVFIEYTKSLYV